MKEIKMAMKKAAGMKKKTGGKPKKGNVVTKKDPKGSKPKVGLGKKSIYNAKF
jgi:hypothetical protein